MILNPNGCIGTPQACDGDGNGGSGGGSGGNGGSDATDKTQAKKDLGDDEDNVDKDSLDLTLDSNNIATDLDDAQIYAQIGNYGEAQDYLNSAIAEQQAYLAMANKMRDDFVAYLNDLVESGELSKAQLAKFTTVTVAWDSEATPDTFKPYLGVKIDGEGGPAGDGTNWCAENDACAQAEADGIPAERLNYTITVRPRQGKDIPVCNSCQDWINESLVTVSGAEGDSGGAWKIADAWVEYDITGENEPLESPPAAFDYLGTANAGEAEGFAQGLADAGDDE